MSKSIEYGSGIIVKELPDKILICAENKTRIKEGNFLLESDFITIEAGHGVKISSKGKDTLCVSVDHTKMEEAIFDLRKEVDERLKTIEAIFLKIVKDAKK